MCARLFVCVRIVLVFFFGFRIEREDRMIIRLDNTDTVRTSVVYIYQFISVFARAFECLADSLLCVPFSIFSIAGVRTRLTCIFGFDGSKQHFDGSY